MSTYVLIMYLSIGKFHQKGGVSTIDGFTTMEKCEEALFKAKMELPKYEWGYCMRVEK